MEAKNIYCPVTQGYKGIWFETKANIGHWPYINQDMYTIFTNLFFCKGNIWFNWDSSISDRYDTDVQCEIRINTHVRAFYHRPLSETSLPNMKSHKQTKETLGMGFNCYLLFKMYYTTRVSSAK
jgi:hypothetical protein